MTSRFGRDDQSKPIVILDSDGGAPLIIMVPNRACSMVPRTRGNDLSIDMLIEAARAAN